MCVCVGGGGDGGGAYARVCVRGCVRARTCVYLVSVSEKDGAGRWTLGKTNKFRALTKQS